MNNKHCEILQHEREKLNALIDEALKNGTPINETHAIMEQYKKVDQLLTQIQKVIENE